VETITFLALTNSPLTLTCSLYVRYIAAKKVSSRDNSIDTMQQNEYDFVVFRWQRLFSQLIFVDTTGDR